MSVRSLIPRQKLFGNPTFFGPKLSSDGRLMSCSGGWCVEHLGRAGGQTMPESAPPYWVGFIEYMYRSYGDPRTEQGRKLLAERSPINKVGNIKKPMADLSRRQRRALQGGGKRQHRRCDAGEDHSGRLVYVVYPDEGHGFAKPPNRLSYIAMTEAFFARHLGGAFQPVGGDLEDSSHEIRAGGDVMT
jgi:acylaminoacyl-peptidase